MRSSSARRALLVLLTIGASATRAAVTVADGQATFALSAPSATEVTLGGDFLPVGGPTDIAYQNNLATQALLQKYGIQLVSTDVGSGGHTWKVWRQDLRTLAPLLFRARGRGQPPWGCRP